MEIFSPYDKKRNVQVFNRLCNTNKLSIRKLNYLNLLF